jgi:TonB family protein
MIKTKEVSIKNIAIILAFSFAISTGYYLTKPKAAVNNNSLVFAGDEVVVKKALTAVKGEKALTPETALKADKGLIPLPILPPRIVFSVLPEYPAAALVKGLEGVTILSVYISLSGQPEQVQVKLTSGCPDFDQAAQKAVSQWRFAPAAQAGAALACWYEVPIKWQLSR